MDKLKVNREVNKQCLRTTISKEDEDPARLKAESTSEEMVLSCALNRCRSVRDHHPTAYRRPELTWLNFRVWVSDPHRGSTWTTQAPLSPHSPWFFTLLPSCSTPLTWFLCLFLYLVDFPFTWWIIVSPLISLYFSLLDCFTSSFYFSCSAQSWSQAFLCLLLPDTFLFQHGQVLCRETWLLCTAQPSNQHSIFTMNKSDDWLNSGMSGIPQIYSFTLWKAS